MIISDTSVWIEFFRGKISYRDFMGPLIEDGKVFALECIFGELLQGVRTQREIQVISEYWGNLPKIDHKGTWIEAGLLSSRGKWHSNGVGLIDLAIVSAARRAGFKIWTLDKKLMSVLSDSEIFHI